jgi:ribosomal protein S27E
MASILTFQLLLDILVFICLGLMLLGMLLIPSKRRIQEHRITYLPGKMLALQYSLGFIAVALAGALVACYFLKYDSIQNILNPFLLAPLGGLLIYNTYSTSRLVKDVELLDRAETVTPVEEAKQPAKPASKAASAKKPTAAPKRSQVVTIQCQGCSNYLKVEMTGEHTTITCPVCGMEGEL